MPTNLLLIVLPKTIDLSLQILQKQQQNGTTKKNQSEIKLELAQFLQRSCKHNDIGATWRSWTWSRPKNEALKELLKFDI